MTYPRQVDRSNAVWSLLPTAKFVDRGTHIEWTSDNEAGTVTEDQIAAQLIVLQKAWDDAEYMRDREFEYPFIGDQLDQLYHDIDTGKFGADAKTGAWFVGITSVKNAYPKP